MRRPAGDLLRGTALAVPAAGACWLLAEFVFAGIYYLPVLLALAMVAMLMVAWVIHLKEDGFFRAAPPAPAPAPSRPEPGRPFPAFEDGVLERARPAGKQAPLLTSREVMRALLWGAAELGLVSVLIYRWVDAGLPLTR